MQVLQPNNEYVNRSWSSDPCPVELLKVNGMDKYIYSVILTDKTESIPSLNSFYLIQKELGSFSGRATLSYKLDGWNFQASYVNGHRRLFQTRGRSGDVISLERISHMVPEEIPYKGKVTVCMEATISDVNFSICVKQFGNTSQRAAVSTIIANPEYCDLVDLHAHKIVSDTVFDTFPTLLSWGFKVPMWKEVSSYEELLVEVDNFSKYKEQYGQPTDGLVFSGEITRAIRVMAWEEPIYQSFVLLRDMSEKLYRGSMYKEEHAAHRISVGVYIYPITLPNSKQSVVPLTNLQRILDYNLKPGYPIAFRVASSAIADFDENSTKLLQQEYRGREEEYRNMIIENETMRRYMKRLDEVV
jgi:hypothetical protein